MSRSASSSVIGAQNGVQRRCSSCGGGVADDRYVCRACVDAARACARDYFDRARTGRDMLDELEIAATRQAKMARPGIGSKSAETPLAFNERASNALTDDREWLVHAVKALTGHSVEPRQAAAVLFRRLLALAGDPLSVMLVGELRRRWTRAQRIIDRPAELWYAGRCACGTDLYAAENASVIECRECHRRYDVEAQRRALLDLVEDKLATATEICRAVHLLDQPVTRSQIDNWVARGQLARRGRNRHGHAVYRIGDILTLVATSARKRS